MTDRDYAIKSMKEITFQMASHAQDYLLENISEHQWYGKRYNASMVINFKATPRKMTLNIRHGNGEAVVVRVR